MKKFIQYTAILGAVLTVLGFGTAGAAAVNGARWDQMQIWRGKVRNHREHTYRVPVGANTGQEVSPTSKRFSCLPEFSIELDYGKLTIVPGEPGEIRIVCNEPSDFGGTVWAYEDGEEMKLVICGKRTENRRPEVQVFIPEQYSFQEMEIEQASGICSISGVTANEFSAEVAGGDLAIDGVLAGCLDLDAVAGNITYMGETDGDADFDCAAGRITYRGRIMGNVEAQCAAGSIDLELYQEEKEFNYELEGTGGSIQLGETSLGGMVFSREIHNGARKSMELQSAAGNICVKYISGEMTMMEEQSVTEGDAVTEDDKATEIHAVEEADTITEKHEKEKRK